VPYFGAIALLTTADLRMTQWAALLVLYNVIFVLPPLLLLMGHLTFGKRLDARYAELKDRLQAGARETVLWIVALVGGVLLVSGLVEYVARFVIP
jgi:cytochrome c biogenesis protein CcdA